MFDINANKFNNGYNIPSLKLTKKRNANYSIGKSKQSTLFDEELKIARETPGPLTYSPREDLVK